VADVTKIHVLIQRRMTTVFQLADGLLQVVRAGWDLGLASERHVATTEVERKLGSNGSRLIGQLHRPNVL